MKRSFQCLQAQKSVTSRGVVIRRDEDGRRISPKRLVYDTKGKLQRRL